MEKLGLFTECTRYNDEASSENRLTQVFAAAFNYSATVRKVFFELIGCKEPYNSAFVATQQQDEGSSRPDMLVYLEENLQKFIVVESKTDLKKISTNQLRRHKSYAKKKGTAERFVLISRYQYNIPNGWTPVLWYDLAQDLMEVNLKEKSIDSFVCQNFVDFLKEYGYMKSTCITIENFEKASECIKRIRMKQTPSTSVTGLLDVQRISGFISLCLEYVNLNSDIISEKVKRKSKAPVFSYWYENEKRDDSKITLVIKQKINNMRNGVSHISFMFQQMDNSHFSLSFDLWQNVYFVTLAKWCIEVKKKDKFFNVWRLSTKRKAGLGTQLFVCDVAKLAIEEWDKNYFKAAEKLGFDKHGTLN